MIEINTALILIDIQKGLDDIAYYGGHRNNPEAESNARKILDIWRQNNLPIFHVKHNSTNPNSRLVKGKKGNAIKDIVKPIGNEPIIEKEVNSAFINTDLKERLEAKRIQKVIIVGLTTDHCISSSVRMAANLGFDTILIADATATFDKIGPNGKMYAAELIHEVALASLSEEFAEVLTTEELFSRLKL